MTNLIAKSILKNKYWIVESEGSQIGTIQATEDGGVVYVRDQSREKFASIKLLSSVYNVSFSNKSNRNSKTVSAKEIYGYPTTSKPFNVLWDLKNKVPVFTKEVKSKSYFCAGYFLVYINDAWAKSFCPKLITLNRYKFLGPYRTKEELEEEYKKTNG
jgi:hypothetical protein